VDYADAWIEDQDFKDPDTGQLLDRELLNQELTKIEKPAGIANPKDFRNEIVKFALRSRANNGGRNPAWTSYEKIREVIEKRMFSQVEDLLPVISFGSKKDGETEKKHEQFVERMAARGYTERQVRDRRLNPSSKSLENRQRFLRRARALVQSAVSKSSQGRDVSNIVEGGEIDIPTDGVHEPRLYRGSGGVRDFVLPGNREFVEGDTLPRSAEGGGRSLDGSGGEGEDAFRFTLSREEFLDLFLDDLELPDLAKRRLAEVEREGVRRAGYAVSGSPANIAVNRTMRLAMARRIALRRPRLQTIKQLKEEIAEAENEERGRAL
jgi:hypothetical protein